MPSVRGIGISQLEMTFCDIHTCDLGKGLVKVRNLCIQQQVPFPEKLVEGGSLAGSMARSEQSPTQSRIGALEFLK